MHPAPRHATFEDTDETEETSLWRRGKSADEAKKRGDIWREWSMNYGEWQFISYNWLFLWDQTFYKWGFVIVLITGKGPKMYGEWWSSALESISSLNKSLCCPKAASKRGSNLDGFWTPRNFGVVGETNKNIPGLILNESRIVPVRKLLHKVKQLVD